MKVTSSGSHAAQRHESKDLVRRMWRTYMHPHMKLILVAFCYMGVSALMTGALAAFMQPIIDDVFTEGSRTALWWVAGGVFTVFALRGLSSYKQAVMMNDLGQRVVASVQRELYAHLIRADMVFLHNASSGQLLSRVINDVQVMRMAMGECLAGIGSSSLTLIILVGVMFVQDWKLAIAAFVSFPAAAWFVARVGKRLRRVSHRSQEAMGQLSGVMGQTFAGARQVKAYGMEPFEEARINGMVDELYHLATKAFRVSASTTPFNEVISGFAIVTVIVYGGLQVMADGSTPGQLFSFITAFLLAYEPIKKLSKLNAQFQSGLAAAERVFSVLDKAPQVNNKPDAKALSLTTPTVRLQDVVFAYGEGAPVLQGISMDVAAGQTVALVGPSGAGKSSILNLVLRLYDVQGGAVLVDGHDVRDITTESLRRQFALVSQEIAIFDESVRANIAYGRIDATEQEIEAAAKAAYAHEFIMKLPEGYNTIVGENGAKLSGGQRQRLSIARAMLRNAPILLLDEATSALDTESERAVQEALTTLQQGRTTIVIAHRLSTITNADLICVMDKGHIVERGTHAELVSQNGLYARLWRLQGGGEFV